MFSLNCICCSKNANFPKWDKWRHSSSSFTSWGTQPSIFICIVKTDVFPVCVPLLPVLWSQTKIDISRLWRKFTMNLGPLRTSQALKSVMGPVLPLSEAAVSFFLKTQHNERIHGTPQTKLKMMCFFYHNNLSLLIDLPGLLWMYKKLIGIVGGKLT